MHFVTASTPLKLRISTIDNEHCCSYNDTQAYLGVTRGLVATAISVAPTTQYSLQIRNRCTTFQVRKPYCVVIDTSTSVRVSLGTELSYGPNANPLHHGKEGKTASYAEDRLNALNEIQGELDRAVAINGMIKNHMHDTALEALITDTEDQTYQDFHKHRFKAEQAGQWSYLTPSERRKWRKAGLGRESTALEAYRIYSHHRRDRMLRIRDLCLQVRAFHEKLQPGEDKNMSDMPASSVLDGQQSAATAGQIPTVPVLVYPRSLIDTGLLDITNGGRSQAVARLRASLQVVPETLATCAWHATNCVAACHMEDEYAPPITAPNEHALCAQCLVNDVLGGSLVPLVSGCDVPGVRRVTRVRGHANVGLATTRLRTPKETNDDEDSIVKVSSRWFLREPKRRWNPSHLPPHPHAPRRQAPVAVLPHKQYCLLPKPASLAEALRRQWHNIQHRAHRQQNGHAASVVIQKTWRRYRAQWNRHCKARKEQRAHLAFYWRAAIVQRHWRAVVKRRIAARGAAAAAQAFHAAVTIQKAAFAVGLEAFCAQQGHALQVAEAAALLDRYQDGDGMQSWCKFLADFHLQHAAHGGCRRHGYLLCAKCTRYGHCLRSSCRCAQARCKQRQGGSSNTSAKMCGCGHTFGVEGSGSVKSASDGHMPLAVHGINMDLATLLRPHAFIAHETCNSLSSSSSGLTSLVSTPHQPHQGPALRNMGRISLPRRLLSQESTEIVELETSIAAEQGKLAPIQSPRELKAGFALSSPLLVGGHEGELQVVTNAASLYLTAMRDIGSGCVPDLLARAGAFAEYVLHRAAFFERHWTKIVKDVQTGTLDAALPISTKLRSEVEAAMVPDIKRAAKLDAAFRQLGFHDRRGGLWSQGRRKHANTSSPSEPTTSAIVGLPHDLTPIRSRGTKRRGTELPGIANRGPETKRCGSVIQAALSIQQIQELGHTMRCEAVPGPAKYMRIEGRKMGKYICQHPVCVHLSTTAAAAQAHAHTHKHVTKLATGLPLVDQYLKLAWPLDAPWLKTVGKTTHTGNQR
ncbi:hypothetical protein JKP88DRAFT_243187 [Tribonema minus]|uniref:Uncharacterized protein n=1 Tax=Tribonema minus TaxID=303371 RepID=A0A835ZC38_9STRA|nr:hypothetical protein JKP88DRAFT_243187 [Tribonema minus]